MVKPRQMVNLKKFVVLLEHAVAENGALATIAMEQPGKRTRTGIVVFAKGVAGSPEGSIVSEKRGTLTVVYNAQELLDFFKKHFTEKELRS